METFGAYLKANREKKGIRLEEIASITKIHIHALQHLENGRWEKLPPDPFLRGFVVAYAKYVGLDAKECLDRYRQDRKDATETVTEREKEIEKKPRPVAATPTEPVRPPKTARIGPTPSDVIAETTALPVGKIVGVGVALGLVALISSLIYVGKQNAGGERPLVVGTAPTEPAGDQSEVPDSPFVDLKLEADEEAGATNPVLPESSGTPVASAPVPSPSPTPDQTAPREAAAVPSAAAATGEEHKLVIQGNARTWMKIVVDDQPPIEYFLPKGKSAGYAAKEKIKLVVGDYRGASVTYNNQTVEGRRLRGNAAMFVFPAGSRFPQDAPPPAAKSESVETPENLP